MSQKKKKNAVIIGAVGHCRVISSMLISQKKYEFIKILDFSEPKEKKILNINVEKIDNNFEAYNKNGLGIEVNEKKLGKPSVIILGILMRCYFES